MFGQLRAYLPVIIAIAVVAGALAIYAMGRTDGTSREAARQAERIMDSIEKRNRINENVDDLSVSDLCRELGGVQCDQR